MQKQITMDVNAPPHANAAYERDLDEYGDSFREVGCTKSPDQAAERYAMLGHSGPSGCKATTCDQTTRQDSSVTPDR